MDSLFNVFFDVTGMSREQMISTAGKAQETIEDMAVGLKGISGLLQAAVNNEDWGSINNQVSETAILIERMSDIILLCKRASGNLNYHLNQPATPSQKDKGGKV